MRNLIFQIIFLIKVFLSLVTVHSDTFASPTLFLSDNEELEYRQNVIKNMTVEAWNEYKKYAWESRALKPVSKEASNFLSTPGSGQTIIASLSTLHLMGLEKEFKLAKEWVKRELNFTSIDLEVNVYETITEYIGGLLSVFALTGDLMFKEKATEIGDIIKVAFNSPTGLLYPKIIPKTKKVPDNAHHNYISFTGHTQPELIYLAYLNNDTKLQEKMAKARQYISTHMGVPKGHYTYFIDVDSGQWKNSSSALGQNAKDFYYNPLRAYLLQSTSTDIQSLKMYISALEPILAENSGPIRVTQSNHVLVTYYNHLLKISGKSMEAATCYLGAMLSLGSRAMRNATFHLRNAYLTEKSQQLAVNLTESCHLASEATNSSLLPNEFAITDEGEVNVVEEQSYLT